MDYLKLNLYQFSKKPIQLVVFYIVLVGLASCDTKAKKDHLLSEKKYRKGELPVQEGMTLFNDNCASCHNFFYTEMGPNLSGITAKIDKKWLKSFILNPQKMIAEGDKIAVEQFERFNVYMPAFSHLDDNQLENLLAFIHKHAEGEKKNKNKRKGGLINPISEKIPKSTHMLFVEEFVTLPPSASIAPDTRINTFRAISIKQKERLFVGDLRGVLFEISEGATNPYLSLKESISEFIDRPGYGTGFGSFAFHPEFETNGLLYTTHTEASNTKKADFHLPEGVTSRLQWVVSEWETKVPTESKFSGTRRELLRVDMIGSSHGFQDLTFNPTSKPKSVDYGLLYLGIGDGAAALAGYPELCKDESTIWGSIIRIDPRGSNSRNEQYGIPQDNPFVEVDGSVGEVWSNGFRNPHRLAWNANGNKMLVSNIGQHSVEEVNLVLKGADYGWPYREGNFIFDVDANPELVYPYGDKTEDNYFEPVIQFDHDEGNAVCGGHFYLGDKIKRLKGKYLFGDIARGTLFVANEAELVQGSSASIHKVDLTVDGQQTTLQEIRPNERVDLRFGQDLAGDLYLFTKSNGKVYKVVNFKEK